jgi:GNAT superfamily N-acetyltransferase
MEHAEAGTRDDAEARVIVRQATADDTPALAGLIAEFNGPQGDARETAARLTACEDLEVALIAWTLTGAAGFACLRITPAIGGREPHALLTELFVREPFRRQGIARALVDEAERLAREGGAAELYLFTGRQNADAQVFYETLGYTSRSIVYQKPLAQ